MPIDRSRRRIAAARLATLARELLDASPLCAISTVARGGRAHVNTAYFAVTDALELVWLSDPQAAHSRNLRANDSVAVAVYDSRQTWGEADRGIQLFGHAREAREDDDAAAAYARRFDRYDPASFAGYRLYVFAPERIKLFDERTLGAGVFVSARASGGRLEWERTEVYRSGT